MVSRKLKEALERGDLPYEEMSHKEAYTAQQVAQAQHVPGDSVVKVVVIKHGDDFALLALPATFRVEISKLKEIFPEGNIRLATEYEIGSIFPDCQIGAMPPFGNLYKVETWVDDSLMNNEQIVFQSGDHTSTIKMKFKDWEGTVHPKHAIFSLRG
ncbi:MAG TPA: YbaK/EbsC family protein [Bdellovibrionota bacterium]|nr:YbaK/EbsC family protein [Bdellovibrionota bacterium]